MMEAYEEEMEGKVITSFEQLTIDEQNLILEDNQEQSYNELEIYSLASGVRNSLPPVRITNNYDNELVFQERRKKGTQQPSNFPTSEGSTTAESPWWLEESISSAVSTADNYKSKGFDNNVSQYDGITPSSLHQFQRRSKNEVADERKSIEFERGGKNQGRESDDVKKKSDSKPSETIDHKEDDDEEGNDDELEEEDVFVGGPSTTNVDNVSESLATDYRTVLFPSSQTFPYLPSTKDVKDDDTVTFQRDLNRKIYQSLEGKFHSSAVNIMVQSPLKKEFNSRPLGRLWCHLDYSTLQTMDLDGKDAASQASHNDPASSENPAVDLATEEKTMEPDDMGKETKTMLIELQSKEAIRSGDVLDFRKGMELCLASFVTVFHHLENDVVKTSSTSKNSDNKENDDKPSESKEDDQQSHSDAGNPSTAYPYVPLSVALMLWTEVLLNHLKRTYSSDLSKDEFSARREAETMAYKVSMALLSTKVGAFKVRQTGGRKDLDQKVTGNPVPGNPAIDMEDEYTYNDHEDEVEIRLRDEQYLRYAWYHHPILRARLNRPIFDESFTYGKNDTDEMMLMMDSSGILSDQEVEAKQWIAMFTENVLKKLIDEANGKAEKEEQRNTEEKNSEEKQMEQNRTSDYGVATEKTLPYLYAIRYLPTFLLKMGSFNPPLSLFSSETSFASLKQLVSIDPDIKGACRVMNDQRFIARRLDILGIFEGSMIHLDDCQAMMKMMLNSGTSFGDNAKNYNLLNEFVNIHKAIASSTRTFLARQNINIQNDKMFMNRIYRNDRKEMAKFEETECVQRMTSQFEVGRVLHALGVSLGQHQLILPLSDDDNDFSVKTEILMYPRALNSYKEALRLLSSGKLGVGLVPPPPPKSNEHYLQRYYANMEAHANIIKEEVARDIEMNIADSLSCLSYCKDAKASKFEEALGTAEEALTIYKKHFGDTHPTVSNALHNIGTICVQMQRYKEALNYYEECVTVTNRRKKERENKSIEGKQTDGNDDIVKTQRENDDLSKTFQCMGNIHKVLLNSEEALKCYAEAYALVNEFKAAKNDLSVAKVCTEISDIYLNKVRENNQIFDNLGEKAITFLKESLRIRKYRLEKQAVDGDEQLLNIREDIANNLYSMACLRLFKGENDVAMSLLQEATAIRNYLENQTISQKSLDSTSIAEGQHDSKVLLLSLMGRIHIDSGENEAALDCYEQQMTLNKAKLEQVSIDSDEKDDIFKLLYAEIDIGCTLTKIGNVLFLKSEYKKAIEKFKASLRTLDQATNTSARVEENDKNFQNLKTTEKRINSSIAHAYYLLGKSYLLTNKYEKSLKCFQDLLKLRDTIEQNDHLEVCDSLELIGTIFFKQNNKHEAIIHFEKSVTAREKLLSDGINCYDDPFQAVAEADLYRSLMVCYEYLYKLLTPSTANDGKEDSSTPSHVNDLTPKDNNDGDEEEYLYNFGEIAFKMGKTHSRQGKLSEALELYSVAIKPMEDKFGKDHSRLAELLFEKGSVQKSFDMFDEAAESFSESIRMAKKATDYNSLLLAKTQHSLGDVYMNIEKHDEAMANYKDAFATRSQELGNSHIDTANTLHQLGIIHLEYKEDLNLALQYFTDALKVRRTQLEQNSVDLTESLHFLGKTHHKRQEPKQSLSCFSEELKMRKSFYVENREGNSIKEIADCINSIGEVYFVQKQFKKARKSFEDALRMYHDSVGAKHLSTVKAKINLGNDLYELQEYDEARNCFQDILNGVLSSTKDNQIERAFTTFSLGLVYCKLNQDDDAMENFIISLGIYKKHYGKDNAFVIDLLKNMGSIFMRTKSYDKALKCFGQALDACLKLFGGKHEKTGELSKRMGEVMIQLGKHGAALDHYHDAASVIKHQMNNNRNGRNELQEELLETLNEIVRLTQESLGNNSEELANILSHVGNIHAEKREYDKAMTCFTEVLRIHKFFHGSDSIMLATDLHNIGSLYYEKQDYEKSIKYFDECMRITSLALGPDSHILVDTMRSIGNAKKRMGSFDDALEMFQDTLRVHRLHLKSTGKTDDLQSTSLLHNLGQTNEQLGNYDKALDLYEESLQVGKRVLGNEHPEIANILCSIGNIHRNISDHDKAMGCYEYALQIRKATSSGENIAVARITHSIGAVHDAKGEYTRAITCYEDVLGVYTAQLGPDNADTAKVLGDIGSVLDIIGNNGEAMKYFKASLSILTQKIGENDISVADTLHNVGAAYDKSGNFEKAMQNYQDSLEIYGLKLNKDHIKLSKPLHNMGVIYAKQNEYSKSVESFREAIRIKTLTLGSNHREVADSQFCLGNTLRESGQLDEALSELTQCYETRIRLHGKNNLDVADTCSSLGLAHLLRHENEMALNCFVECLRVRRLLMDGNSMKIAEIELHVGKILYERGNLDDSESCLRDALSIMVSNNGKNYGPVADVSFALGIVLCDKHEFSESLDKYNEALRVSKDHKGPRSIVVANILENIGIVYKEKRSYNEAIKYFQDSLTLKQEILGKNHEDIAPTLQFLGTSLLLNGQYNESIEYLNESVVIKRNNPETNVLELSDNLNDLGKAFEKVHEFRRALNCYEEAHDLRKLVGGESSWDIAETLQNKGRLYLSRDQKEKALNAFQDTMKMMEYILEVQGISGAAIMNDDSIDPEARLFQLQTCYEDILRLLKSEYGADHLEIANILMMKGNLHAKKGELDTATTCYTDVVKFFKVNHNRVVLSKFVPISYSSY